MALVRCEAWALMGTLATVAGCGSARELSGSMRAYEIGNYHQAAEGCDGVDGSSLGERKLVRYYVYCGLAHYQLGDQQGARNLLMVGKQKYDAGSSTWLKPNIVDQMNKALGSLSGPPFAPTGAPIAGAAAYPLDRATSSASIRGRATE